MSGYGKIYESSYWGVGVCENTIGWGSSYKSIANCTDASFSYPQDSYPTNGVNPTPTITGDAGGTFTATPSGLTLNASTGEITLSTSTVNSYTIRYTLPDTTFAEQSMQITAPAFASTESFEFNGVDSYFNTSAYLGDLISLSAPTSYTVSAWIKTTSNNTQGIVGSGANNSSGLIFRISSGEITFGVITSWATSRIITTTANVADGNWHHIVGTYNSEGDESGNTLYLYVNGAQIGSNTGNRGAFAFDNYPLFIGAVGAGTSQVSYFNGFIDEVGFWNSALTSAAVTEIYGSGVPNDLDSLSNASSPTAWWRMGE